jgi:hypothetical protein
MNLDHVHETLNYYIFPTDNSATYYFEHKGYGDERAGRIWIENDILIDYDGVFELPKEVIELLKSLGIHEEDETY